MSYRINSVFLVLMLVLPVSQAADWSGKGEAGFVSASGNTDSQSINVGLSFGAELNKWRHDFAVKAFRSESDNVIDAENVSVGYIGKRELTERSYLFGSADYLDDQFDGFTEQASVGFGYGYRLFNSEPRDWEVALGLGYRDTSEAILLDSGEEIEGKDLSGATVIVRSEFRQRLTSNTEFFDNFKAEIGSDNTFIENDASIVVAMNDLFSLKAGFLVRNNSDPAPGADETDTVTTLNLVYNFGQ